MPYVLVFGPRMAILVYNTTDGCAAMSITWRESSLLRYLLWDLLQTLLKDSKLPMVLIFRLLMWRESLLLRYLM